VVRSIFGAKRNEMVGGWRKCHIEELYNLYSSSNIIRMIKSRRTRLAWYVARMGEKNVYRILVGNPEGMRLVGRPRRRWETILKRILCKYCGMVWTGLIWLRKATSGRFL
jgi:hypothetical protein